MARLRVVFTNEPDERGAKLLIRRVLRICYSLFGPDINAAVEVSFCSDEQIRRVNNEKRGVDRPTDVLSFPMFDFHHGSAPAAPDLISPDTGRIMLGDLLLSLERAREQAEEYGHSVRREYAYLCVHGLLHLIGFDHVDEGEEKALMRNNEEQVMTRLGLER